MPNQAERNDIAALFTGENAAQGKAAIELKDAIDRLYANPDFQFVFGDVLYKQEATRLTSLLGDPNMDDQRSLIMEEMLVIGKIRHWLRVKVMMGRTAESEIKKALAGEKNAGDSAPAYTVK